MTLRDAERLRVHLEAAAEHGHEQRAGVSFTFVGIGAGVASLGLLLGPQLRPDERPILWLISATFLGFSAAPLFLESDQEKLHAKFLTLDVSSERARSDSVFATELEFKALAEKYALTPMPFS